MRQLLGEDYSGVKYYLQAPSWDCDWYWGYGYIQSYYSHQHANGKFESDDNSDTDIFTGKFLKTKTFSDHQGWILRELMATFYQMRDQAALVGLGGMHVTANPLSELLIDKKEAKRINEQVIPVITKAITAILNDKTEEGTK